MGTLWGGGLWVRWCQAPAVGREVVSRTGYRLLQSASVYRPEHKA